MLTITIPLIVTAETFALPTPRQQRVTHKQCDMTCRWLTWHLGAATKYALASPLAITLIRLAPEVLPAETLRDHLESTRAGVASWVYDKGPGNDMGIQWSFEQRVTPPGYRICVEMLCNDAAL